MKALCSLVLYTYMQVITMLRRGCGASKTNLTKCTHSSTWPFQHPCSCMEAQHEKLPRRVMIVFGHRSVQWALLTCFGRAREDWLVLLMQSDFAENMY